MHSIYSSLESPWSTLYSSSLNFFRYLLRLRRYERKSVEVGVFRRGWVNLNADFRGKGATPTNHSWHQSSRVIALSCGIKISAVRHLVLSQSTRVADRRTDRQISDRQNYDSQDRPRICSRGKNERINHSAEIPSLLENTVTSHYERSHWSARVFQIHKKKMRASVMKGVIKTHPLIFPPVFHWRKLRPF